MELTGILPGRDGPEIHGGAEGTSLRPSIAQVQDSGFQLLTALRILFAILTACFTAFSSMSVLVVVALAVIEGKIMAAMSDTFVR
jgi:uncharacterized membrane protein YqjE